MTGEVDTPQVAIVTAVVWLYRRGDQVLAVRPHGSDAFFLPGGMPEPGESYAEATAREVREETGMTVDPASLRETARIEDDAYGRPGFASAWSASKAQAPALRRPEKMRLPRLHGCHPASGTDSHPPSAKR